MSFEETDEWADATRSLHQWSQWFKDKDGMIFSFLWWEALSSNGR